MATLALAAVGAAAGGALLPAGVSLLGLSLTGAAIGSQVGALAGAYVDRSLFASSGQGRLLEGPRLSDLRVTSASEGAFIPRLYGRARLGGQVIWAAGFEEEVVTSTQSSGSGKGGLGGGSEPVTTTTTSYRYYGNFAVGLCEGEITALGRVWADGRPLDLSGVTWRLHKGGEEQLPDSLIAARLGAGNAPAYRGLAYIVFERLPLADFGNRIPQLSFEVFRAVDPLERQIRAVTLIPGGGEFVYAPQAVTRRLGAASSASENVHTRQGGSDWTVAIDQLQATLPNVSTVSLICGWFGTDLRAEMCLIRPGVDGVDKETAPLVWSVAGESRAQAHVVSAVEGRAAYGGTPSDETVIAAILDLKARGLSVTLSPFVFMDVPAGNALRDPYGDASSTQPAYPWRGRITITPAPGVPGSPDKTSAAASALAGFIGTASPAHFSISDGRVSYTGPAEWSYRRFILHHAALCVAAGGVDAFVIGSELRGLTHVRSAAATYPFVAALVALAADVKGMLGSGTRLTYAADWSEYFGHHPPDGSGDVLFHLDPVWASSDIAAIGIDMYWPLADWRDGRDHLDALAGARSVYDLAYLRANIAGGEGYDWHYATEGDRLAQLRTPITDGGGKPWIYRFKDLRSWWSNPHYNRIGGEEADTATAWVPQSKPFWFTEVGCPAIDKGANQPNVFVDTKSSESHLPHFSRGTRDDFMQRRYLQAVHAAFDPAAPDYVEGSNPVSPLYAGRMLDPGRLTVYTWDARPWPAFPEDAKAWSDGGNWRLGHWIMGRLANAPLDAAIAAVLADAGFADVDVGAVTGSIGGLVVDRMLSARDALQPVLLACFIDTRESGGRLVFAPRAHGRPVADLVLDDLVETRAGAPLAKLARTQESDLPASAKISYISAAGDYPAAVEEARRLVGQSGRVATAEIALVLEPEQAAQTADMWLFEAWAARERVGFALPPSRLALEPGDVVTFTDAHRRRDLRVIEIGEHGARDISTLSVDMDIYAPPAVSGRPAPAPSAPAVVGQPLVAFLDLPLLRADDPAAAGYVAAAQEPWPGGIAVHRSPESSGYRLACVCSAPATTGLTLDDLQPAPSGRFVTASPLRVRLDCGTLASVTPLALFAGANLAAVANGDGQWEVLQFRDATLVAPHTYALDGLLRGQAGTEHAMRAPLAAGARFVLLDGGLARVDLTLDELGLLYSWRCGPAARALGDATYTTASHAFRGEGLRPLAPVHVRGQRSGGGDLLVTWVRRTRMAGDGWEASEVPLGEEGEAYAVDILAGVSIVRTLTSTMPSLTYSAAEQVADFGAPQAVVSLRIAQVSATFGRGTPAFAVL